MKLENENLSFSFLFNRCSPFLPCHTPPLPFCAPIYLMEASYLVSLYFIPDVVNNEHLFMWRLKTFPWSFLKRVNARFFSFLEKLNINLRCHAWDIYFLLTIIDRNIEKCWTRLICCCPPFFLLGSTSFGFYFREICVSAVSMFLWRFVPWDVDFGFRTKDKGRIYIGWFRLLESSRNNNDIKFVTLLLLIL